jgi:hypothetical protein
VLGAGKGTAAKFSSNATTGGTSGAYRVDQADDLAFLDTFGVTPP